MAFVEPRLPSAPAAFRRGRSTARPGYMTNDPYLEMSEDDDDYPDCPNEPKDQKERDVKVTDMRDLAELLKLKNPMKPTQDIYLKAITLDDGTRIEKPGVNDLRRLKPSRLRPVTFHWRDRSRFQTKAPKQYDEVIQRLLNAGPSDMEDLVRANWQQFDKAFFFRITELKQDTPDPQLRQKIANLEKMAIDIVGAAQAQMRKNLPEQGKDARVILDAMLEKDKATLLWPAPPEAFVRLAETITTRATRAKFEDAWFESILEIIERYAKRMEVQQKEPLFGMALIIMQRLVTEWFRHDSLWEETAEGQFIFRLMSIERQQWPEQLYVEQVPLDTSKLRDELKIISETKVVQLPMGSKLQIYAAKYLQELVDFVERKDDILQNLQTRVAEARR